MILTDKCCSSKPQAHTHTQAAECTAKFGRVVPDISVCVWTDRQTCSLQHDVSYSHEIIFSIIIIIHIFIVIIIVCRHKFCRPEEPSLWFNNALQVNTSTQSLLGLHTSVHLATLPVL